MATAIPTPGFHPAPHDDGMLYFELFDAVAVWGWEWVLAEIAEVARVRGDGEVEMMMAVVSSGLAENGDDGELVTQEPRGGG
jgi:hypothetical protein